MGSVRKTDSASINQYGTYAKTVEGRIFAHMTQASAEADRDATITEYAYPLRLWELTGGFPAITEDLGRAITISDTLKNISSITAYTEQIIYDLDKWEVQIKARWPW